MKLIFSILLLTSSLCLQAQGYTKISMLNRKSKKMYNKALEHIQEDEIDKSIVCLEELSIKLPDFYDARYKLGWQYLKKQNYILARKEFESIVDLKEKPDSKLVLKLVQLLEHEIKFELAIIQILKLHETLNPESRIWNFVNRRIKELEFRQMAYSNPKDVKPELLGPEVNSNYSEYFPAFNAEGTELIFTKRVPFENHDPKTMAFQEDLYMSQIDSLGKFSISQPITELNTLGNEGTHCFSQDGTILIFTACDRDQKQNGCDLYISFRKNGIWSRAQNMGTSINSRYWESQPSLSPDNRTLYYSSTRKGGFGGSDIWKVELTSKGWSAPVNLGSSINSKGNEGSPFLHADNTTLYFRSDGHIGLGEFDLFISKRKGKVWSDPINMSYPINSTGDEGALFVDLNGNKAYYTSNQFSKDSNLDILYFELPDEFKPEKVSYIKLTVRDKKTKESLISTVELIKLSDSLYTRRLTTNSAGTALMLIQQGQYLIAVKKESYLFFSENLVLDKESEYGKSFHYMIELESIPKDSSTNNKAQVLNNIFFETGSSKLLNKSNSEILNLLELLNSNPKIVLTIVGHTDSIGNSTDNMNLSKSRAKSVYTALIKLGTDSNRLDYIGKGETEAIASNDTELGRSTNRRTEFIIHYLQDH